LHVLTWLIELEPAQADLLECICVGSMIARDELRATGALESAASAAAKGADAGQTSFL
jgi:hypothetical protein